MRFRFTTLNSIIQQSFKPESFEKVFEKGYTVIDNFFDSNLCV
jgi:hypothetical protein